MEGLVTAVSRSAEHSFSKKNVNEIRLLAGLGVEGDAHLGMTVQHLARVARDPGQPNYRQVHLIAAELHDELRALGFAVSAGDLGENITTRGLYLLGLPTGACLHLGAEAVVEVTGLRNPCQQIEDFQNGLLSHVVGRDENGRIVRRAGVLGVVLTGGVVRAGDAVRVALPAEPHRALDRV